MEVEYSQLRAMVLLDELVNDGAQTLEHTDVGQALKRLPLVHRYCLVNRVKGKSLAFIADTLFGGKGKLHRDVVKDFLEAGEMRLYLEVNGVRAGDNSKARTKRKV